MKKNDIITLDITDTGSNGEGVGRFENTVVFVGGAITGERVKAQIVAAKPAFAVGKLIEVLSKSPYRVTPRCEVFGMCGGCAYQHCAQEFALKAKIKAAENTLKKISGIKDIKIQNVIESDRAYGYRNKVSFAVRRTADSDFKIGFFADESNRVVEVSDCPLAAFDCAKPLKLLKRFMADNGLKGYGALQTGRVQGGARDEIRHIVLRQTDECIMVALVVAKNAPWIAAFDKALNEAYGGKYSFWVNINNQKSNVIFGDKFVFIGGIRTPKTSVLGVIADVHPASFFQVNTFVRDKMYLSILDALNITEANSTVLDAYSGAGALSALIARKAGKVFAVEIVKEACAAAEKLKAENGINNMEVVCGDCAKELPRLLNGSSNKGLQGGANGALNGDINVLLDPPRNGCDKAVLQAVVERSANSIVYVSCNPATLGRDLNILAPRFSLNSLTAFDMFPNTPHLEIMAVLSRV